MNALGIVHIEPLRVGKFFTVATAARVWIAELRQILPRKCLLVLLGEMFFHELIVKSFDAGAHREGILSDEVLNCQQVD